MGYLWCSLVPTEDPWNISAFFFAFMQLLLALLVLAHSVIACITSQMMRLYGWEYPSQRECMHPSCRIGRLNSGFLRKNLNVDVEPSMNTSLRSTENVLKRSSSENWQAVRTKSLLCPKGYRLWNAKQSLSFRCDRAASVLPRERAEYLDMDILPVEILPFAGSGTKSYADSTSRASIGNELASWQKYCFLPSSPLQQLQKSRSVGRAYDHFDDVGRVGSYVETIHDNGDVADETELCLNTPAHDSVEIVTNVVKDADVCRDVPEEEVVSSSKELSENGSNKGFSDCADLNVGLQSSQSSTMALESREDIHNKNFTALPLTNENGDKVSYFLAAMKNLVHEKDLISKDDDKGYTIENVIMGLKEAVLQERKKLCNLYAELETERISSETAANEAMSMISRLQEEKASLRMQAAHYRRIAEERATYDHQAMQLLKEILIKKEKENFLLQKQVYAMRSNCCKDVRAHSKRRKSFNRRLFPECQQLDLPKNEMDEDGFHSSCITSEENENKAPIEKQPLKRLKGNTDYLSSSVQRVVLKPVYSSTDPLLSVGSDESQDSATGHDSSKEDMEPQLCIKDVPKSSDEHDVLSQRENLSSTPCDGLSLWSV